MSMPNRATSRLVLGPYSENVVVETARDALREIGGTVTCGFVFVSADYAQHLPDFLELLQLHAHVPVLTGCSGLGLVSAGREEEHASGFSFVLLHLPEKQLYPVRLPGLSEEGEL